jgi:hypothetical protein
VLPKCRDGSTVAPILVEAVEDLLEGGDGGARWRLCVRDGGRRHPSLTNRLRQHGVSKERAAALSRRYELRHDFAPIRDQDSFTGGGKTHVLTELVLEYLETDRSHGSK